MVATTTHGGVWLRAFEYKNPIWFKESNASKRRRRRTAKPSEVEAPDAVRPQALDVKRRQMSDPEHVES